MNRLTERIGALATGFLRWLFSDLLPESAEERALKRNRRERARAMLDDLEARRGRRDQRLVSEDDYERSLTAALGPRPTNRPEPSVWGEVGAYAFLVAVLLGGYLAWVLATGWVVVTVLSTSVSTPVWIATIAAAAVLGIVAMYAAVLLKLPDRLTPFWLAVVPTVVEVIVFATLQSS